MRINIVNYEQGTNDGILSKFANKLNEKLLSFEVNSKISSRPETSCDINHHINYLPYKYSKSQNTINTLMITHIWEGYKLDAIKRGMETADMGICMSGQVLNYLVEHGIDAKKLTVALPAHDGRKRRHQIVSILTNVYPDGCKREWMFRELVKNLNKDEWAFRIMGSGWEDILTPLVAEGLQVDYFNKFDKKTNDLILDTSDYALYFGNDEGSMGLLDAMNAGVKTIGTRQGFHIEMGLDYYFDTVDELKNIFAGLNQNKVKMWTWEIYTKQHLNIWTELYKNLK